MTKSSFSVEKKHFSPGFGGSLRRWWWRLRWHLRCRRCAYCQHYAHSAAVTGWGWCYRRDEPPLLTGHHPYRCGARFTLCPHYCLARKWRELQGDAERGRGGHD